MILAGIILSAVGKITALAAVSFILDLLLSRIHTGEECQVIEERNAL